MDAKELAKKEPMAAPGFTVLTPKQETEYDRMITEKQMSVCESCEGERPAYPAPAPEEVPATGKKNSKR
jgi:hypothetical protein